MIEALFYPITGIWAALFAYWALSRGGRLWHLRDIFFLTITYYALCVPFDMLIGNSVVGFQDAFRLDVEWSMPYLARVLFQYTLCGLAFLLTYCLIPRLFRKAPFFPDARPNPALQGLVPLPLLVVFSSALLFLYVVTFWEMHRGERYLAISSELEYKLTTVVFLLITCMNILYIWSSGSRSRSFVCLLLGCAFSLVSGARTWIVITTLVFCARYRVRFSKLGVIALAVFAVVLLNSWKIVAEQLRSAYLGVPAPSISYDSLQTSLSAIEGGSTYSAFALTVSSDPPYYLGRTYLKTPLEIILLHYFTGERPERLADEYVRDYAPQLAAQGYSFAFPALAEAWLNFGWFGPLLVGLCLGAVCRRIDSRPRGIMFVIMFFFVMRFFRSDFASVLKFAVVIFGGLLFGVAAVFRVLSALGTEVNPRRSRGPVRTPAPLGNT